MSIGRTTQAIPAGGYAYVHDIESLRGRGDLSRPGNDSRRSATDGG
jgi:hypothetical protein